MLQTLSLKKYLTGSAKQRLITTIEVVITKRT